MSSLETTKDLIFQQNGVSPHFAIDIRNSLNALFQSEVDRSLWFTRVTLCDFFL